MLATRPINSRSNIACYDDGILSPPTRLLSARSVRPGGATALLCANIDPNKTLWEVVSDGLDIITVGKTEIPSRAYVSKFGFKGPDQQKKAGVLSGGERNRLKRGLVLVRQTGPHSATVYSQVDEAQPHGRVRERVASAQRQARSVSAKFIWQTRRPRSPWRA